MHRVRLTVLLALNGLLLGCSLGALDIEGKACDSLQPCPSGYRCLGSAPERGRCLRECLDFEPSNQPRAWPESNERSDVTVPPGEVWALDTSSGQIDLYDAALAKVVRRLRPAGQGEIAGVVLSEAGPDGQSLVWALGQLAIGKDARLVAFGARPLVLLAQEVVVEGILTVGADQLPDWQPGAGGAPGGVLRGDGGVGGGPGGGQPGEQGDPGHLRGGSGGGGFGSSGGRGGTATQSTDVKVPGAGGASGPAYGTPELVPLVGGSGGAAGIAREGAGGGNGGGALQVSARCAISVTQSGTIDASGGGGGSAIHVDPDGGQITEISGGGGGSGGAILLEAALVSIAGAVGANGGGGGAGAASVGRRGARGKAQAAGAAGGTKDRASNGSGGDGSDAAGKAADGQAGQRAGGGGGGAGRIRINTPSERGFVQTGSILPAAAELVTRGILGR